MKLICGSVWGKVTESNLILAVATPINNGFKNLQANMTAGTPQINMCTSLPNAKHHQFILHQFTRIR